MKNIGIFKAMKLCADYEKMSAEEKQNVQNKRLEDIVKHARKNSPYYKELYQNVPEDFELTDLPPVDKKGLMSNWNDWVCDRTLTLAQVEKFMEDTDNIGRKLNKKYLVFTTSGSTGNPLVSICDKTTNNVMGGISARRSYARKEDLKEFIKRGKRAWQFLQMKAFIWETAASVPDLSVCRGKRSRWQFRVHFIRCRKLWSS